MNYPLFQSANPLTAQNNFQNGQRPATATTRINRNSPISSLRKIGTEDVVDG